MTHIQPLFDIAPYRWIFWAVFLFAYVPEFMLIARSTPAAGVKSDRGSMGLIILAGWLAFPAAFIVSSWAPYALLSHRTTWFASGLVLLLAGSFLRRYCFRTLGRFFTGNVQIQAGQPVIQHGPYRLIRHPSYTGGMIMYLGSGMALTNWLSALILFGMGAGVYAYRVHVEEWALADAIGQPYRGYMQRTKRFIPFVF